MIWRQISKYTAFILLLLCQISTASVPKDTASFKGEVNFYDKNDTLYISFHITPFNFDADSIRLRIYNFSKNLKIDANNYKDSTETIIIYRRTETIPSQNNWKKIYRKNDKIYIDGNIKVPLDGESYEVWSCHFWGLYKDGTEKAQDLRGSLQTNKMWFGVGMGFLMSGAGYFQSDFEYPLDKKGTFFGHHLSMQLNFIKYRFELSTSWSGLGKNFTFSEPFRTEYRYYTGTRNNFLPQLFIAGKLTKIKLKENLNDKEFSFNDKKWGAEAGIAFEGPFERIGYSYSTAFGGYHTFELLIADQSSGNSKLGTRYTFIKKDNLWTIGISVHLENWNESMLEGEYSIKREYNRPFLQKIISYGGAIALPTLGVIKAYEAIK